MDGVNFYRELMEDKERREGIGRKPARLQVSSKQKMKKKEKIKSLRLPDDAVIHPPAPLPLPSVIVCV